MTTADKIARLLTEEYESVDDCDLHKAGFEALVKTIRDAREEMREECVRTIESYQPAQQDLVSKIRDIPKQ